MSISHEVYSLAAASARGEPTPVVSIEAAHWIRTHEDLFTELVDLAKQDLKSGLTDQIELILGDLSREGS